MLFSVKVEAKPLEMCDTKNDYLDVELRFFVKRLSM